MRQKAILLAASTGILLSCVSSDACAQDQAKPIAPDDPRLTFSFAIQPGGPPFQFKVKLKSDGTIAGVAVYRNTESRSFQELPSCMESPDQVDENWGWGDLSNLIAHADLNFDGNQDLELIQNYIPHLGKKLYCVFLWDPKTAKFAYSADLTNISANVEANPGKKTLTTREDWQGGAWQSSTYRWRGDKLEMIEQTSLLGDWGLTPPPNECNFTFTCSRLVNGKMVTTLEKPVCTVKEMENLPNCPSSPKPASGQNYNRQ